MLSHRFNSSDIKILSELIHKTKLGLCLVGLYIDARSAFEYLVERKDIDRSKIVVFGR